MSKKSTKKKEKRTIQKFAFPTMEKSILPKLGAMEGGRETIPSGALLTPSTTERAVMARIPSRMEPRTFRASRATMRKNPRKARSTGVLLRSPQPHEHRVVLTMIPAL